MKLTIEAPDEWGKLLDDQAAQDGHSNRAAVIRKIVNLFFAEKSHFVAPKSKEESTSHESHYNQN